MTIHTGMGYATVKNNKVLGIQPMSEKSPLARFRIFNAITLDHRISPAQSWEQKEYPKYSAERPEPASIRDSRIMKSIQFYFDSEEFKKLGVSCSFSGIPPTITDINKLNYDQSSFLEKNVRH